MNIFNRAELLLTMDVAQQEKVCAALRKAGIRYTLRAAGTNNIGSGLGNLMVGVKGSYQTYQFYVHKKDLEAARAAIHGLT